MIQKRKVRADRVTELIKQIAAKGAYLEALEDAVAEEQEYFFDDYMIPDDNAGYHQLLKILFERIVRYDKDIAELEAILLGELDGN
jgi:hypothetical protein